MYGETWGCSAMEWCGRACGGDELILKIRNSRELHVEVPYPKQGIDERKGVAER